MLRLLPWIRRHQRAIPPLWREIVLIGAFFGIYTLIQDNTPLHAAAALHRGASLLRIERDLHIDVETPMDHWAAGIEPIAVVANYYYVVLHFLVPAGILLWMHQRRPERYRFERNVLMWITVVSLVCFWLAPTAPPRLLPGGGFIDTVAKFHTIGGYETGATKHAADQFASMPSMHIALALWSAVTMYRLARHRGMRIGWLFYPIGTALSVLLTGNHYLIDIAAGVAAWVCGVLLAITFRAAGRAVDRSLDADREEAPPEGVGEHIPATTIRM